MLECLDLAEKFADSLEDPARLAVSQFDNHPNEETHGRMAEALHKTLSTRWPDLGR